MSLQHHECLYVRALVFAPLWTGYDYLWPETLGKPEVGIRILVPFGNGKRQAVVSQVMQGEQPENMKTVYDRFDISAAFNEKYRSWLARVETYYLSPPGDVHELAFSWAANDKHRRFRCVDEQALAIKDPDLVGAFTSKRAYALSTIAKHCGQEALQWRVLQAVQAGLLQEVSKAFKHEAVAKTPALNLREPQKLVVDEVMKKQQQFFPLLLFGCTGSGKTEVYLQAAEQLVQQGKQVLILVPEIGLTPMWLSRLTARFDRVAIWHSGLSITDKIAVRHQLATTQVLLGTRSALFLPLERLAMIVIDEEHDTSFKQQDGIAYSARDMSLLLAQELQIPVILGSATPSLESWRLVQQRGMACFKLSERVYAHTVITPEIIDMRGTTSVVSPELLRRLKMTHASGKQAMLYLNRRGYAPALQCTACGYVPSCRACSLRLTLHRKEGLLRCHACDYQQRISSTCKNCGEQAYLPLGSGTERLEDELRLAIPGLKLARFDRDMIRKNSDLLDVLGRFEAGEIDCLIGTQMLVKGHHFPNVTLVGVINADLGMNMPDFRASERWWQQMTQVFGRTGRGEQAGQVVVQTWNPEAPWFDRLDESRAEEVLNDELSLRQMTNFPPCGRWVRVVFSAVAADKAARAAAHFAQILESWEEVKVSGPMPCALEKLAGRFRFEVILRDASRKQLPWKLLPLLQQLRVPSGVRRKVDVDPQELM